MLVRFVYRLRRCQQMMKDHMSDLIWYSREQRTLALILGYNRVFRGIYLDSTGGVIVLAFIYVEGLRYIKQVPRSRKFLEMSGAF